jgi:protein O-mannosyl-transferase
LLLAAHRQIGRGPAAAAMLFCGLLFPALGFVNTLPMRYSFVADHFAYLASAVFFAGVVALLAKMDSRTVRALAGVVIVVLAGVTWNRTRAFGDAQTLWRDTLAKNPSSWMAQHNLGNILLDHGRLDAAEVQFREAIRLKPDHGEARVSLGRLYEKRHQPEAAARWYREAIAIAPRLAMAHYNLGTLLAAQNDLHGATRELEVALALRPEDRATRENLARLWNEIGARLATQEQLHAAQAALWRATQVDPELADAHLNLGIVLQKLGKPDEARAEFETALRLRPGWEKAKERLRS